MENKAMDPVTLEVIWNRFLSVANEQQDTLIRTAFSTIVRESQDLACGMFDTKGRMIAQSISGTPGHINAMATSMKHFLAAFPPDKLAPGDVLITNDPWQTAGQINDITITTPIFRNGKMVALFANTCHSADIGGRILSAEAREVFEEGLRIPIMKLFDRGEPNQILMQIVRANVRQPDEVIGDFYAQTACNETGGRALLEMMDEFELDSHRCGRRGNHSPLRSRRARRNSPNCRAANGPTKPGATASKSRSSCAARSKSPAMKSLSTSPARRRRARAASTSC